MFRTRDFVLLFVTIVFLMVAIGTTIFARGQSGAHVNDAQLQPSEGAQVDFSVVVEDAHPLSRADKLRDMRAKVAASESLVIAAAEATELAEVTPEAEEVDEGVVSEAIACKAPIIFSGVWPLGVKVEEREGVRVFYTESTTMQPAVGTGTPQTIATENVLVRIPMPFGPSGRQTCPGSDVIGIAKDGSLIRNSETSLYSVFGSDTLIGYALDGFPIYGVSTTQTDECGGAMLGTYRYYLSSERDTILHCYSGTPVTI